MINRSLIRIKTVQILYSYLLVRSDFRLIESPEGDDATNEAKFAYKVYLSLLYVLIKLGEQPKASRRSHGIPSQITAGIAKAPEIKTAFKSLAGQIRELDSLVAYLASKIKDSSLYADFHKSKDYSLNAEEIFWKSVLKTIIERSEPVDNHFRKTEGYTARGFERGISMVKQSVAAFEYDRSTYENARKSLHTSLESAYDMYIAFLSLPLRLTERQVQLYQEAKNKYAPTSEDLNPPTRFVDNLFAKSLAENKDLVEYMENNSQADVAQWEFGDELLDRLLELIRSSQAYEKYMEKGESDFVEDARFWRNLLKFDVLPSDTLAEALESQSIFWNDDMATISEFVLKTIKRAETNSSHVVELLPDFASEEDEKFGDLLFDDVVANMTEYRALIDSFINTRTWDTERIPFMDIVVIMTAIGEMLQCPSIPVAVTLNEYIEIANAYCSPKSGQFVNGILYSVMNRLHNEGKLQKPLPSSKKQ